MRAQFVALLALGLMTAGPAAAASGSEAVLVQPSLNAIVVFDGRVWRCAGRVCRASGAGRSQSLTRDCARAARRLGPLAAYSRSGSPVDGPGLALCNAGRRS